MKFNWDSLIKSINENILSYLPNILIGIGLLILIIIIYKLILYAAKKILKLTKVNKLNDFINDHELLRNSSYKINIQSVIINIIKLLLLLIFLVAVAEIFELKVISEQIANFISYLPKLFYAVIIFGLGAYMASQLKKLVRNMLSAIDSNGSKAISSIVFYLVLVIVSITALNQAGIDTSMISANISYVIGAILIATTIAVGLGSRDIVYRLILGYYTKKNLEIGMKIKVNEVQGTIIAIDNICMVLQSGEEKIVFPIKEINDSVVKILD